MFRYKSIKNILQNFEAINNAISQLATGKYRCKFEAIGIQKELSSVKFFVCLKLFNEILCPIHTLHKYLQSITATLGDASNQISATSNFIKSLRNEAEWYRIVLNIDFNEISRKRHINSTLTNDFVVYSTVGQRETITEKEHYYKSLYLPVIDCVIQEFNTRFSDQVLSLSKSVDTVLRLEANNIDCIIDSFFFYLALIKNYCTLSLKLLPMKRKLLTNR